MPFKPPSVDTLEVFEPPSVDSLEQEETKSPGYLGPSWPAQEGEEAPQAAAPMPEDVLQGLSPFERFRMTPFARGLLGPTQVEREGMAGKVSGSQVVPQELLNTAFQFASVPPPIAEPIKAVTQPLIEAQAKAQQAMYPWKLAELNKGIAEGVRDLGLELPLAAGAVGMGKNIGRAMLGLFSGEFLISVPEQYQAFKDAAANKNWTEAAKIATKGLLTGALLGSGGIHETRGALAELAKAKREQGQLPPTQLGLARLKENLLNLVGRPTGLPIPETPAVPPLMVAPHVTPQTPEERAIAAAEPILPQAAQAAKETKGPEYATEKGLQPSDVRQQRKGDDQGRTPQGPSIGGGVQPATPSAAAEAPRPAPEPKRVLLDGTKTKLKQIGWNDTDIADLEAGNLSVPDIVARKLRPFDVEYGGGPEHAKALEEARMQGVADAEKILAEKAPLTELTPEERLIAQRDLDEALGQETTAQPLSRQQIAERLVAEGLSNEDAFAIISGEKTARQVAEDWISERTKLGEIEELTPSQYDITISETVRRFQNILEGVEPDAQATRVETTPKQTSGAIPLPTEPRRIPTYGERYIAELGVDAARKRIDHLNRRIEEEIKNRNLDAVRRLQQEAQNIANALEKPAPPPKGTPTMPSAAKPSIPTPELPAAPGAKPLAQVPISEATTASQITQEPFLGKTKAEWTPDYYTSLTPDQRRVARVNVINALDKIGSKTKITQTSKPPQVLNAIDEIIDAYEKKKTVTPTTVEGASPAVPSALKYTPEQVEYATDLKRRAESATLPSSLTKAAPRFGYGKDNYILVFIHDADRVAYVLGGKGKSIAHDTFEAWFRENIGKDQYMREKALKGVRAQIKSQIESGEGITQNAKGQLVLQVKPVVAELYADRIPLPLAQPPPSPSMPPGPGAASPAEFAQRQAGQGPKPPLPPPPNPPIAVDASELPTPDKFRQPKDYTPFNRLNSGQWNFYFGRYGGDAKAAWERMTLGEFKMRESIARDVQDYVLRPLKALPRPLRKQGGKAFYEILDGKKMEDIRKEWENKPDGDIVIAQAEGLRTRLEEIRTTIRDLKRDSYTRALSGMNKDALVELFQKNVSDKVDISAYTKDDLANGLVREAYPDDWGIADGSYLPHLFFGHWKVSVFAPGMEKRQFVTRAQTAHEADVAVFKLVKQNPELKDAHFTIEEDTVVPADMIRLGDRKFWRMIMEMKDQAHGAIDPKQAVQGIIGRKSTKQKWFGSLQHRIGLEGYSKDYRRVMSAYLSGFHRWKELTAINREVQPLIEQTARDGRQQAALRLTDIFDNLWGKPTRLTIQFDNLIRRIPGIRDYVKPLALDRWARNAATITTNLMLRTARFMLAVNRLQPLQGLYPMVGERIMVQAKIRQHTKEGRALLDEAGVTFDPGQYSAEGLGGKFTRTMERLSGEQSNQELAFLAMYQHGIERGLAKPEAIKYAKLRGQLLTQFTPMITDMPELFEGPVGRVLFQFKRFPVKQVELMAHMAGQRQFGGLTRMLLMFGAIGGTSFFLRQFFVDPEKRLRFKRAMDEQFGEKGGDAIMYGLPGLLGADISGSIVLGEEPWGVNIYEKAGRQLAGPTLSMGIEALRGIRKEAREPISEWERALAVMRRIPSLRQIAEIESLLSGDLDVMTPEGERKFRRTVTDALMGLGAFKSANEANLQIAVNGALEVEKERKAIMNRYFVASLQGSDAVGKAVKEVIGFNERWPEYVITSENMSRYRDYRQRNIGKTDVERAVPKQLIPLLPASQR